MTSRGISDDAFGADPDDDALDRDLAPDKLAEQRAVRELLRSLPDPGPVPPDVLDRITETLRALDAERAAGAEVVPLRRRTPHRALWLAAAAAVVLGGGGAVVSRLGSDTSPSNSTASVATPRPGSTQRAPVYATGARYGAADLAVRARALLAPAGGAARAPGSGGAQRPGIQAPDLRPAAAPATTVTAVVGCLRALGLRAGQLLAADDATYEGQPAFVLVVDTGGASREVRVTGRDCRPGAAHPLDTVRLP